MYIDIDELSARESSIVEWKQTVADERKLVETVVAFANDILNLGGGYIVCGAKEIQDDYGFKKIEYVGLTATRLEEIKKYIADTCYNPNKVNPPIIPYFEEKSIPKDASKRVLIIVIDGTNQAHTYKSDYDQHRKPRYYIRSDSNTREANNGLLRELLRKKGLSEPWDKLMNQKAKITDIDELILRTYLQRMKLWSEKKTLLDYLSDTEKIEEFIPPLLARAGVNKALHPKNFTLMVFGKKPIDFCVGAYSMFTIFDGNDKSSQQAETQWITGTIVEQTNTLIELLNIESTIAIDKSSDNANQTKYPKIALKEAVVNAIVHRDYEIDQPVRVEVYSDRVEIFSPGGLPFHVEKTAFQQGKAKPSWRNQAFGRIFHKLNLAQHQGSGIEKIISSMREEGSPAPIFMVNESSVTCVLPAHPRHIAMKQLSEAESDIVIRNYQSAYKKLLSVLEKDIYNYRAIELFCDVNNLLETPENILSFCLNNEIVFEQIRPNTLVVLSESLSLLRNNQDAENLSKKLLNIAINGKLEEKQLIKVAYTLKKLGNDKEVVDFVDSTIQKYPSLSHNSFLLDQKGRALIDLAKLCQTSFIQSKNQRLKLKAKIDFEKYINEAQKVLSIAYQYSEDSIDRDFITKALDYIKLEMQPFLIDDSKNKNDQTLYISHIPIQATEEDIKNLYKKYGQINKITMQKTSDNNYKFAFIEFEKIQFAQNAFIDRYNIELFDTKIYTNQYKK